jgi:hypothetical protein
MVSSPFAAHSSRRPHQPAFAKGRAWFLLKATSTGRLALQAFSVEGRQSENAQHKKKTMKTKSISKNTDKTDSGLLNRTAQHLENNSMKIDFVRRQRNRALPTEAVLHLIHREAKPFWDIVLVVGKWLWIQFDEPQPRHITARLSELGFHWNKRRQAWQHPCGHFTASTPRDPREKYLTYHPANIIWR